MCAPVNLNPVDGIVTDDFGRKIKAKFYMSSPNDLSTIQYIELDGKRHLKRGKDKKFYDGFNNPYEVFDPNRATLLTR